MMGWIRAVENIWYEGSDAEIDLSFSLEIFHRQNARLLAMFFAPIYFNNKIR